MMFGAMAQRNAGQPAAFLNPQMKKSGLFGAPMLADPSQVAAPMPSPAPAPADSAGPNQFADMIGPAPTAPKHHGFDWQMAIASLAATLNGDNQIIGDIAQRRRQQQADYLNSAQHYRDEQQIAGLPGMTRRELATYIADPKAWASANATRYQAATLGEKDTRVYGNPLDGGSAYQAPRFIQNGVDTVQVDPMGGKPPQPVYSGTTDAQQYARGLGLDPNTPDYNNAQQDYVLRGNGPTAYGYDVGLENTRQQNRIGLEGVRQGDRLQLRNTPTYSDTHPHSSGGHAGRGGGTLAATVAPILAKVAQGQTPTPGEQQALDLYYHRGGRSRGGAGGGGSAGGGHVAVDAHGNKIQWNGSAWVPIH